MLKFNKETINLPTSYTEKTYSFTSSGDVIIPDSKDDIKTILFVDCVPTLEDTIINLGQITITGNAEYNILYAPEGDTQKLIRISTSIPYKSSFDVPNVNSDSNIYISLSPKTIDSKILNGRKINLSSVINVGVSFFNKSETQYIKDVNSEELIEELHETTSINTFIGKDEKKTTVKDTVMLPTSLPNIDSIIKYETCITNKENVVSDDKIIFKGDLNIKIFYVAENDDKIYSFNSVIPFSDFAHIDGIDSDSIITTKSKVNSLSLKILPDSDDLPRVIEFDSQILSIICAFSNTKIDVIRDLYCTKKALLPQAKKVTFNIISPEETSNIMLREIIDIPDEENISIISAFGRPKEIKIEECENGFILKGNINISIIYKLSNGFINTVSTDIPIEHIIDSNINTVSEVYIENIEATQNEIGKIDLKINISFLGNMITNSAVELLDDVTESENLKEKKSGLTIYFVKPSDTYWNIAKKFNTTIEKIKELNNIDDNDKLIVGKPIVV